MNQQSNRYQEWFANREPVTVDQPAPEPTPRPRYVVWVAGSRATIGKDGRDAYLNGQMLGMADNLTFVEDENEPSDFLIAVESPEEGIALMRRIANCMAFGIIELEEDEKYHEWYNDNGEDASELVHADEEEE
jgi:hypothetical protein